MILNNRIYASEALKLGLLNILFKKDFEKNTSKCYHRNDRCFSCLKHAKTFTS